MHPILTTFSIGGAKVVLWAYGTFYTLAWLSAVALATLIARRRGFSWGRALLTFALALAAGVVGARALDVAVNWGYYAQDPTLVYSFGFRGFALYGGLIVALVVGMLLARAFHLPLWRLADGTPPAFALGIVLMRVGCFLNGCCFGTVTSLPWGVRYPVGSAPWQWEVATGQVSLLGLGGPAKPLHPTQFYEMIAAVLFAGLSLWLLRRKDDSGAPRTPSGMAFLTFALGFTLFRLGDHFLRAQLPSVAVPRWFYPLLYVLISAAVSGLLVWRWRLTKPAASRERGGQGT